METQQIDMLFLELSQVTKAQTEKEIKLQNTCRELRNKINRAIDILDADTDCCAFDALQVLQKYT